MRWRGRRQSDNVVDRRGSRVFGSGGKKVGGGAMIILLLVSVFFGEDVSKILGLFIGGGTQQQYETSHSNSPYTSQSNNSQDSAQQDEASQFVSVVLAETEDTWNTVFAQMGKTYQPPKLVLYTGQVSSACGLGQAQSGPFYCPGDYQIYLDLSFLQDLQRMGAPGDFAFAYVIAHEVGHHVQNIVGIADQVRAQQARTTQVQSNALSVRLELQADCLAGVWINHTERRSAILEDGDIEEGLAAAAAVGDDRILSQAGRTVNREAFTHGSSAERVQWFKKGASSGNIESCNTFG